jgi:hypothetical protein
MTLGVALGFFMFLMGVALFPGHSPADWHHVGVLDGLGILACAALIIFGLLFFFQVIPVG